MLGSIAVFASTTNIVSVPVAGAVEDRTAKSATAEDAAQLLEDASSVVVIPGCGMAVAQAQHRVRDLHDELSIGPGPMDLVNATS